MLEKLKLILQITDAGKDGLLQLIIDEVKEEFHDLTHNSAEPETLLLRMAAVRYNLIKTEGLSSQSFDGMSENYKGYDDDLMAAIRHYRKVIVV